MRVNLLHFASFRDATGRQQESRDLPAGARVRDLWAELAQEIPQFRAFSSPPATAVNREYVDADTLLSDGDEVAFLPPVAGG